MTVDELVKANVEREREVMRLEIRRRRIAFELQKKVAEYDEKMMVARKLMVEQLLKGEEK